MSKNFCVIGLGGFGTSVAETLSALGSDVLAVDISQPLVDAIADNVTHAVCADTTDERALKRLGIPDFDCIVISTGESIRSSTLTTVLCKELGAKYVVCKASDELHAKLLHKTGADKVVLPERESGVRLARSLVSDSILDYLELSDEYSINEICIPLAWIGHSLIELNVRAAFAATVIAIRRTGGIIVNVDPKAPLEEADVLVMIGANDGLRRIADMPS